MGEPRIVIDHVGGSRRGQRQEFPGEARVRFGRHPECEVSFDAHKDIDASSRHAELRPDGSAWVLVDLGSSNGTYVEGHRVTEAPVERGAPLMVDFGSGGPRVRLFIGDDSQLTALPPPPATVVPRPWLVPAIAGAALVLVAAILFVTC